MYKAFFFDMDGVLFNSMPHHARAWESVMSKYNLNFTARDTYLQEGRTGEDVISECYRAKYGAEPDKEWVRKVYDEKTTLFHRLGETYPVDGIKEVLDYLKQLPSRPQIWIVTGSGQQTLFAQLEETFPAVFRRERMITAYDVKHGKPDPEPYLRAWEQSGCRKEECMVIENAPLGIRAGKGAGLFTVGVNTGILTLEDLANAGADEVFSSMSELLYFMQCSPLIR
ncbi:MAG TPA: beta-phosphoglucomutase [Bacteroidales bacterium]|nr:beta-phosphoglucomutase [Bacteroidales bacterium]